MHQLLFNLILVLLPTQLAYHLWPEWAMVLGRRVDFLSPTLHLTDILIFLLLVTKFPKIPVNKITLGILLFITLNVFFALRPEVAAYKWVKVLEYVFLGLYIRETKQKFSSMAPFLSIGVLYSSLIAIGQFLLQRTIGGPLWFLGERTFTNQTPGVAQFFWGKLMLRSYATFPHPNVLGGFLAILLPLILTQWKKRKLLYSSTILLGCIALFLTFSRSAWIAAIVGILFVFLKKKFFIPLLTCLVILLFPIVSSFGLQDESIVVRQELNASALAMFSESPMFGKGLGNFLVTLPDHLSSREIYFLQPVHNIYLLLLSETGVVGLFMFLWILWRAKKHWVIIIVFFLGLVDHYFLTLQQGQLLLVILLSSTIDA